MGFSIIRFIILDKNSHLKFHSISMAFLVKKKKGQKQISWEITCQHNKHSMTGFAMVRIMISKKSLCLTLMNKKKNNKKK